MSISQSQINGLGAELNTWINEWDQDPARIKDREKQLARCFLGQRYVLGILSEIYSPFTAIMDAHTELFSEPREWKPIIYKVISGKGNIAHVVGTRHDEFGTLQEEEKLFFLSSQLRNILMNTNSVACEIFDDEIISKSVQLAMGEVQKNNPCSKFIDSFHSIPKLLACDAYYYRTSPFGLENHIRSFIAQAREHELTTLLSSCISLESENILVPALHEFLNNTMKDAVMDAEQIFIESDLSLEGNKEGMEQYYAHKYGKFPFFEDENSIWVARNNNMAVSIPEIMEKHGNVVVAIGMEHLFGQRGVISQLRQRDNLTVKLLPREEVPGVPSYNPNISMTLKYSGTPPADFYLWKH